MAMGAAGAHCVQLASVVRLCHIAASRVVARVSNAHATLHPQRRRRRRVALSSQSGVQIGSAARFARLAIVFGSHERRDSAARARARDDGAVGIDRLGVLLSTSEANAKALAHYRDPKNPGCHSVRTFPRARFTARYERRAECEESFFQRMTFLEGVLL